MRELIAIQPFDSLFMASLWRGEEMDKDMGWILMQL
jgi:hypothetical protein